MACSRLSDRCCALDAMAGNGFDGAAIREPWMTALDAAGPNAAQIDYWNTTAGPSWVEAQEGLDAELLAWGLKAMEALAPRANERVIDVGCGCGATTLELARRLGWSGQALGVDISAPMLAVARRRAEAAGLTQARFVQ